MTIFYVVLVAVHLLVCLILILVILFQAGRGGGLVETFNISDTIFGTKTSSFLQKATTVSAITFMITCLALAFVTAQKSKSLLRGQSVTEKMLPLGTSENIPKPVDVVPAAKDTAAKVEEAVKTEASSSVETQEKVVPTPEVQ